jgi:hypothetical protein
VMLERVALSGPGSALSAKTGAAGTFSID